MSTRSKFLYYCVVVVFQDEVLLMQARKTQYQAMSLLTPAEMISAGQRFFAAGDRQAVNRTKSAPTGQSHGAKIIGVCVCVCVCVCVFTARIVLLNLYVLKVSTRILLKCVWIF